MVEMSSGREVIQALIQTWVSHGAEASSQEAPVSQTKWGILFSLGCLAGLVFFFLAILEQIQSINREQQFCAVVLKIF